MKLRKIAFVIMAALCAGHMNTSFAAEYTSSAEVAAGYDHLITLNRYGRVFSAGGYEHGQADTWGWKNVISVAAGKYFSAALFSDGTVKTAGTGGEDIIFDTAGWTDIVQITAGDGFLAGLDTQGRVYSAGKTLADTSAWENVIQIAAGASHLVALKADGTCAGALLDGYTPSASLNPTVVSAWADIKAVYAGMNLTVGLQNNGRLVYAGDAYGADDWVCASWENIEKVLFIGYDNGGIVFAVDASGALLTSSRSSEEAFKITGADNISMVSVKKDKYYPYTVILSDEDEVSILGLDATDDIYMQSKDRSLRKKPLSFEASFPIMAASPRCVVLALPSGRLKTITTVSAFEFNIEKPVYLTSSVATDFFYGITGEGRMVTNNIKNGHDYSQWQGLEKVAHSQGTAKFGPYAINWAGEVYGIGDPMSQLEKITCRDIAAGNSAVACLHEDGSVSIYGSNISDYDASGWSDIENIYMGSSHLVGIDKDGNAFATGKNDSKQCDVSDWRGITEIAAGYQFTVGLKEDGTCVATGDNAKGQCDVSEWKNVRSIYAGYTYSIGYTNDGRFLYAGELYNSQLLTQLDNWYMTEDCFFSVAARLEEELYFDFFYDGAEREDSVFISLYSGEDVLLDIKRFDFAGETAYSLGEVSPKATSWKFMVWGNDMTPVYRAEGVL